VIGHGYQYIINPLVQRIYIYIYILYVFSVWVELSLEHNIAGGEILCMIGRDKKGLARDPFSYSLNGGDTRTATLWHFIPPRGPVIKRYALMLNASSSDLC